MALKTLTLPVISIFGKNETLMVFVVRCSKIGILHSDYYEP